MILGKNSIQEYCCAVMLPIIPAATVRQIYIRNVSNCAIFSKFSRGNMSSKPLASARLKYNYDYIIYKQFLKRNFTKIFTQTHHIAPLSQGSMPLKPIANLWLLYHHYYYYVENKHLYDKLYQNIHQSAPNSPIFHFFS